MNAWEKKVSVNIKEKFNSVKELIWVQKAEPTINLPKSLQTETTPEMEGLAANINHYKNKLLTAWREQKRGGNLRRPS